MARLYPDRAGLESCRERLYRPQPRVEFGCSIPWVCACGDGHLGWCLERLGKITQGEWKGCFGGIDGNFRYPSRLPRNKQRAGDWFSVLGGGEDYELVFTAPESEWEDIQGIGNRLGVPISSIGVVDDDDGLRLTEKGESVSLPSQLGYDHFGGA